MSENLNIRQIAERLGRSKSWLTQRIDRHLDDFPEPIVDGRKPRYVFADVQAWMVRHNLDPSVKRQKPTQPAMYHRESPEGDEDSTSAKLEKINEKFLRLLQAEKRE